MSKGIIHIGSDHGGYNLKRHLIEFLLKKGYQTDDLGTFSEESVDYPEFGRKVGYAVLKNGNYGIIICGTGIGISIAANRLKGIRAALCHSVEYAKLARQHNNANILALGGRFTGERSAEEITEAFLTTDFEGGRHQKRVDFIDKF